MQRLTQLLLLVVMAAAVLAQYRNYSLPDIPYNGPLMTSKLAQSNRSNIVVKTMLEPLISHSRAMAFILLAEDKSKRTFNSSYTSLIGYFPFNDQDFVYPFYKKLRMLGYFGKSMESMHIRSNGTTLEYLEAHYLKRSRKLFRHNLNMTAGSTNRIESLGNQIYATYPGTRHCQIGLQVHYNAERAPLQELEKCCVMRTRCNLQQNMMYKGVKTPQSADNIRRVSCECDDQFRQCLQAQTSSDADYMGELLYNVLELQCLQTTCNGTVIPPNVNCFNTHFSVKWRAEVPPYIARANS